jgi:hypothetical protein
MRSPPRSRPVGAHVAGGPQPTASGSRGAGRVPGQPSPEAPGGRSSPTRFRLLVSAADVDDAGCGSSEDVARKSERRGTVGDV